MIVKFHHQKSENIVEVSNLKSGTIEAVTTIKKYQYLHSVYNYFESIDEVFSLLEKKGYIIYQILSN